MKNLQVGYAAYALWRQQDYNQLLADLLSQPPTPAQAAATAQLQARINSATQAALSKLQVGWGQLVSHLREYLPPCHRPAASMWRADVCAPQAVGCGQPSFCTSPHVIAECC
jgi:hypothetical protein